MSDTHPDGTADGRSVNWTNVLFLDGERLSPDTVLAIKDRSRYVNVLFVTLAPANKASGEAFGLEQLVQSNGQTYAVLRLPSFMSGDSDNPPMLVIRLAKDGQAATITIDELARVAPDLSSHMSAGGGLDIGLAERLLGAFPDTAST